VGYESKYVWNICPNYCIKVIFSLLVKSLVDYLFQSVPNNNYCQNLDMSILPGNPFAAMLARCSFFACTKLLSISEKKYVLGNRDMLYK